MTTLNPTAMEIKAAVAGTLEVLSGADSARILALTDQLYLMRHVLRALIKDELVLVPKESPSDKPAEEKP